MELDSAPCGAHVHSSDTSFLNDVSMPLACPVDMPEDSFITADANSEAETSTSMPRKRSCAELDLETTSTVADLISNPHGITMIKRICSPTETSSCYLGELGSITSLHEQMQQQQQQQLSGGPGGPLPSSSASCRSERSTAAATAAAAAKAAMAAGGRYILTRASEDDSTASAAGSGSSRKGTRLLLIIPRTGTASGIAASAGAAVNNLIQACNRSSATVTGTNSTAAAAAATGTPCSNLPVGSLGLANAAVSVRPTATGGNAAAVKVKQEAAAVAANMVNAPAVQTAGDAVAMCISGDGTKLAAAACGGNASTKKASKKGSSSSNKRGKLGSSSSSDNSSITASKGPRVRLGGKLLSPEEAEKHLKAAAAAAAAAVAARAAAAATAGSSRAATPATVSGDVNITDLAAAAAAAKMMPVSSSMQSGMCDLGSNPSVAADDDDQAGKQQQRPSSAVRIASITSVQQANAAAAAAPTPVTPFSISPILIPTTNLISSSPAAAAAGGLATCGSSADLAPYCSSGHFGLSRGSTHSASTNSMSSAIMIKNSSKNNSAFNRLGSYNSVNTAVTLSPSADVSVLASPGTYNSYNNVTGGSSSSSGAAYGSLAAEAAADDLAAAAADAELQQLLSQWATPIPTAAAAAAAPAFPAAVTAATAATPPIIIRPKASKPTQQQQLAWKSAFAAPAASACSPWQQQWEIGSSTATSLRGQVSFSAPHTSTWQQQQGGGVACAPMVVDDILPSMQDLLSDCF